MMVGWSVGVLRPIAGFLQPLQMSLWCDTRPSTRDVASALRTASNYAKQAAAARKQLLQRLPESAQASASDVGAAGLTIGGMSTGAPHSSWAAGAAPGEASCVHVQALSRFCWDTAIQPFAAEAAALAATAALPPGTDMTAADVAATQAAAQQAAVAALQHATLLTTLPMWLMPGMFNQAKAKL